MKRSIFIILIFALSFLNAQEWSGVSYTVKDGLPTNTIYEIIQDRKGFIWIGTERGLVRFDGVEFKTFTTEDGISGNEVLDFFEASNGDIYCQPFSAEPFIIRDGRFVKLYVEEQLREVLFYQSTFVEDERGVLIGGARIKNDTVRVNTDLLSFGEYTLAVQISGRTTKGKILIGVSSSSVWNQLNNEDYSWIKRLDNMPPEIKRHYDAMKRSGTFLIDVVAQNHESPRLDSLKVELIRQVSSFSNMARIFQIKELDDQTLLVCTTNGVVRIQHNAYSLINIEYVVKVKEAVYSYADDQNGIWISTRGSGVYYFTNPNIQRRYIRKTKDYTAIHKNDKQTIIAVKEGWVMVVAEGDTTEYEVPSSRGSSFAKGITLGDSTIYLVVDGSEITCIRKNKEMSRLNYRYRRIPLSVFDSISRLPLQRRENLIKVPLYESSIGATGVYVMGAKSAWIENEQSVYAGCFLPIHYTKGEANAYFNKRFIRNTACGINQFRDTILWGTQKGVLKTTSDSLFCSYCDHDLLAGMIYDIEVVGDVIIYASQKNGIVLENEGKLSQVSKSKGMITNDIREIVLENDSVLWAITADGVNRVSQWNTSTPVIHHLGAENGLSTTDVAGGFYFNDTLWLCTSDGINYFDTRKIDLKPDKFPCHFTSVLINGVPDSSGNQSLNLAHDQNSVNIQYVGLDYQSEGKVHYQYRLLGAFDNWIPTQQRELTFPALASGDYTLEVQAMGFNNAQSDVIRMTFAIATPFWRTWWFITSAIAVTFGLAFWIIYGRYQKVLARNKMLNDLEVRNLRSQMNPHFLFNAMLSLKDAIRKRDFDAANNYVVQFSNLMRRVLESTRNDQVELYKEVESLEFYLRLESEKTDGCFEFSVQLSDEIEEEVLIPPMLLQPFLENSIHHGLLPLDVKKGKLTIEFLPHSEKLLNCIITDNGIGREASKSMNLKQRKGHRSVGILATSERLKKLVLSKEQLVQYEDLYDENGAAAGTRVRVLIPFEVW